MAHHAVCAAALFVVLAACGEDTGDARATDASIDARIYPPIDARRSVTCAREGTSSVTGSGPAGSLDTSHVYALAETGFCGSVLQMIVTSDDPLAWPYLDDSVEIFAQITPGYLDGTAEWSGNFAAMIQLPDNGPVASGTLQVDQSTSAFVHPNQLRATVRFDDGAWRFTATIDAPYCAATVCI